MKTYSEIQSEIDDDLASIGLPTVDLTDYQAMTMAQLDAELELTVEAMNEILSETVYCRIDISCCDCNATESIEILESELLNYDFFGCSECFSENVLVRKDYFIK